tara:strand:- start:464 stop:1000 length:537 start_codon:yes stop_codon:yes gene_type:complete
MPSKKTNKINDKKPKKLSPTEKLKSTIAQLEISLNEASEKHLRLKAEFDNFRKRKDKEIVNLLNYEGESVIKQFLSVLDDLGRLNEATSKKNDDENNQKLNDGISLIMNKIEKEFSKIDVKPYAKAGDVLDPELHDALMIRNEDGKNENEILEVFEKGYLYKDRVIRHAKVVVNQTPS